LGSRKRGAEGSLRVLNACGDVVMAEKEARFGTGRKMKERDKLLTLKLRSASIEKISST